MGKGESKATIKVGTEGTDQASKNLHQVQDAQDGLTTKSKEAVKPTEKLIEAQGKLNAAEGDYIFLLSRISPALGGMVDAALKGGKVLTDLGSQKINLTAITKKLTSSVGGAAKGIKLLGATGLAIGGLTALYKAINKVREESARAAAAIKALIDRNTELAQQSQDAAQAITASRDVGARDHRLPFTFAQQESVRLTREAAPQDIREKLDPILAAVGGAQGFGPTPGEFTGAELESLARLGFQPLPEYPIDTNTRIGRRFLESRQEAIAVIEQRRKDARETQTARAAQEAISQGDAGRGNLRTIVEGLAGDLGLDPDELMEISVAELQRRHELRQRYNEQGLSKARIGGPSRRIRGSVVERLVDITGPSSGIPQVEVGGERRSATVPELAALDEVIRRLGPTMDRLAGAAERMEDASLRRGFNQPAAGYTHVAAATVNVFGPSANTKADASVSSISAKEKAEGLR